MKRFLPILLMWFWANQMFAMPVFVRNSTGKSVKYEVNLSEKIADLKVKIQQKEGYAVGVQRLVFQGKNLDDKETLGFYKIQKNSVLQLKLVASTGKADLPDSILISSDVLTFRTGKKIQSLAVYSLIGRQILMQAGGSCEIDISALPDGMYFLKVATEKGISTYKFLKK